MKGYGGAEQNYQNGSFAGCTDPVPFIPDADTGYYSCSEPIIWRQEALECPNNLPPNEAVEFPDYVTSNLGGASGTPEYEIVADECSKNSDCDENDKCVVRQQNVFGECIGFDPEPTVIEWARVCEPGCTEDSDCVEGQVCLCGAEIGRCAPISFVHGCASDADCDDGYHCLMNANASFACQLPGDECHSTVMCEANEQCVFDLQADARMCQPYFDGGC